MNDETEDLREILSDHLAVKDSEGRVVLRIAQVLSLFVTDAYTRDTREAMIDCCEEYFRRWGSHLRWAVNPDTDSFEPFGAGKGSQPRTWLPAHPENEDFELLYHSDEDARAAAAYVMCAQGLQRLPYLRFGYVHASVPLLESPGWGLLPELVLGFCRTLRPVSGYAGIGVQDAQDVTKNYKYGPLVFDWARRFPGLEVDYPVRHIYNLPEGREGKRDGIKGVNWLTVVGDRYLPELGGADKVAAEVAALDSRFVVHRYVGGLLIQAGPRPQLGDARRDVWPELYVKLAKYLRPIRVTSHKGFQMGGPSVLFDKERSEAWLRRFDER